MKRLLVSQMITAALWPSVPALAMADPLALRPGVYVVSSVSCKEPPFAAMKFWDGAAFSGPHSSQCTSRILGRKGNRFHIATTCKGAGDGSALAEGTVSVVEISLIRLSRSRFVLVGGSGAGTAYRWCGAGGS